MGEGSNFLGIGWAFPPTFQNNDSESDIALVAGNEDIQQSLRILFNTRPGERIMQPLFGCRLNEYQFEPVSSTLLGSIEDMIKRAILYYEARIILEDVVITNAGSPEALQGYLQIEISYTVRSSNTRFNFVYDYYVRESGLQGPLALQLLNNA